MELSQGLNEYILQHNEPEDKILEELRRQTHLHVLNPNMLSGPLQGKILEMFVTLAQPRAILEIGTYTGYSAICMARALPEGGQLHTVELDDELSDFANKYFQKAGLSEKIIQHLGDALDIKEKLPDQLDFIFIDGDKREYTAYYKTYLPKLKPGGLLIADNVLWGGKVADKNQNDDFSLGIKKFNQTVKDDPLVKQVILPVRDGLLLAVKNMAMQ